MSDAISPTPYEQSQIAQIQAWREQPPGLIERATGAVLSPVSRLISGIVPPTAIEALLRASDWMAEKTIPAAETAVDGADLEQLDAAVRAIRHWAIAYAGGEGALAGASAYCRSRSTCPPS